MSFDIPFIRPVFPDPVLIGEDFYSIAASNWYTNFGPRERDFRSAIDAYLGHDLRSVTFSSATTALLAALQTMLGQGDGSRHVIVPSFTFVAGPAAIEWTGYRPLLIDVDEHTLQPSLDEARSVLEQQDSRGSIAAILLCNTFGIGNPVVAEWEQLAGAHSIPLVIDSAAGFGSRYAEGRPVGSAGDCEIFSFHATKPFAIGEGGAAVARDPGLVERLTSFQNFGFHGGRGAVSLGLNGKLQEINAAIGLRQLAGFTAAVASRQTVLQQYQEGFGDRVSFPDGIDRSSVCFASVLLPTKGQRDACLAALAEGGVEARAYYSPPIHHQPHFSGVQRASELSVTESVVGRVLSLPVHQEMSGEDVQRIISLVALGMGERCGAS